jgi:hypothetical protein
MIRIVNSLLILLLPFFSFGQEQQEYKSKEQEQYYKKSHYKRFKPLSKNKVSSFKNEFFEFEKMGNYTPYSDSLLLTPYQDSINKVMFNPANSDSITMHKPELVGKIEKFKILKHEKNGAIEAFIYANNKFEDVYFGYLVGIWVAFSTNNGKTWEYLYTGIVQHQPLFLKWYSNIPLIKSETNLQIEACLVRQLTQFSHPAINPISYEVIKDGLRLTLNLTTLRKDTDNDGLTDIVEKKLYTNLNNKDTDGDRIPDNLDLNPRFSVKRTNRTIIFESAVNDNMLVDTTGVSVSSLKIPEINHTTDTTETVLIVTDNPDIQSIQPTSKRVIILSETEYKKHKKLFKNELNDMLITPLFKVDNEIDTYLFSRSFNTWGEDYLVKKVENGWIITIISSWIS